MITGFNTDVDSNGRVYHVQTEDRGMANPIVESLVYQGGEIVASRKSPYADLIASNGYSEEALVRRMEAQHRELIAEIRNGKFGNEEALPFGHSIITNRSLDAVALAFLTENITVEQLRLEWAGPDGPDRGLLPIDLAVTEVNTERPICGATVAVNWVETDGSAHTLFNAVTGTDGHVQATVRVPGGTGDAAIVCQAVVAGKSVQIERPVTWRRPEVSAGPP